MAEQEVRKGAAIPGIPEPGDLIESKYLVEKVLGRGGMGVVLAARHTQIGQRVAIKFLLGDAAHDGNAVERFLREARAAVALSSEHATRVLDVGRLDSGEPFMVMEYLAGIDLAEVLKRNGPLEIRDAVSAVMQACEAIAEAHSVGIVHRDLKPANLFVTRRMDGTPLIKVLDFGISKMETFDSAKGEKHTLTASGSVMGSPGYMSPEQVRSAKTVDPRSDIWALGVILYELLTGARPFLGDTLGETFAKILSEAPAAVRELRAEVPEELAATISQCLERKLDRRMQSVADLAARLAPFAPPEAALLVERISRISKNTPQTPVSRAGSDTMTVPPVGLRHLPPTSDGAERVETSRAWLKSGGKQPAGVSRKLLTAGTVGVLGLIAAALLGWRALRGPSVSEQRAGPAASLSSAAGLAEPLVGTLPPVVPARETAAPPAPAETAPIAQGNDAGLGQPSAAPTVHPVRSSPATTARAAVIASPSAATRPAGPKTSPLPGNKTTYENF